MLKSYLLMASKVYWRRKMFTAINLMCIVLTLAVLLVVTAVMEHSFAPSGVDVNRDRLVHVDSYLKLSKNYLEINGLGFKLIDQYLKPAKHAEKVSALTRAIPVAVYQDNRVEKLSMVFTDEIFWDIYSYRLKEGRFYTREDVDQGRFLIVLNTRIAHKLFGEQAALGKKINVRGYQYEVVGVVDDLLGANGEAKMWAPLTTAPTSSYSKGLEGDFSAVLLAKSSSAVPLLKQEILEQGRNIKEEDPIKWPKTLLFANTRFDRFARGFSSDFRSEDSGAEQVFASIVALMFIFMLLPALNLVNLNLGRMMERSVEIGVRKAFGASRFELVAQFLVENVALSLIACVISLIVTEGFLMWINSTGIVPDLKLSVNAAVFGYGVLMTIIFGIVSGVLPAWRMAKLDPVFALKGNA
ncbi:ABC transporter permease [Undibacterium sp. LX40W]|uniref:ABC transporter permease n=1 Tax=Undibacterium nitidum TaxID=2762298 RepID=A0A923HQJ8_9BURK|nr:MULTISPECIES: ABC transporter permease [Undibacterium]MBC3880642.1 ABC transporter permease [Undibacterium nitidum]MBC3890622.1 ABC transporter permease [Undibacterium sp. LX40W]